MSLYLQAVVQLTQSCSSAITMSLGSTVSTCGSRTTYVRHYESTSYSGTTTRYRPSFDTGSHRPRHDVSLWRENSSYAPLVTVTRSYASPTRCKSTAIAYTFPYGQQLCTSPKITMDDEHIIGLTFEAITLRISVVT